MDIQVTDFLKHTEVFAGLSDAERRRLARLLRTRRVPEGQLLFRQGEIADALYLITDGRVRVSIAGGSGEEKVLAFLGAGDVLGEMALLSGGLRSATAVASTRVSLLQLRKSDFDSLLATHPDVMRQLARVVGRRRLATRRRAAENAAAERTGRTGLISVMYAPRGGAGASTLATNVAVALAHREPDRVVLFDLKVPFGHVPVLLNLTPRTSLAAISPQSIRQMDRESFNFYLTRHADSSLRVLPAALRPDEAELVTGDHVKATLDLLKRDFDYVIIDTGHLLSEANLSAIEAAHNVIMICTPDHAGLRAASETQRIFRELLHLAGDPVQYILNHALPYAAFSDQQFADRLSVRLLESIPFGGDTPTRAALEGRALVSRWPHTQVSKSVTVLAARLAQQSREARAIESAVGAVAS